MACRCREDVPGDTGLRLQLGQRRLRHELRQTPPAGDAAGELEEGFVNVVADLPPDPQATEPVRVGERALHDPAARASPDPFSVPRRAIIGFTPSSHTRRRYLSWSYPRSPSTTSGRRRGWPRLPRTDGTASSGGTIWVTSFPSPCLLHTGIAWEHLPQELGYSNSSDSMDLAAYSKPATFFDAWTASCAAWG